MAVTKQPKAVDGDLKVSGELDILTASDATKEAVNYLEPAVDVTSGELGTPVTAQGVDNFSKNSPTTTFYLLQNSLTDTSAITGTRATTNSGVTVDGNGDFVLDGASYFYNPAGTLSSVLTPTSEWTMEIDFIADNTSSSPQVLFGDDVTPRFDVLITPSSGAMQIGGVSGSNTTGWTNNTWHRLTIEYWLDGATRKLSFYRNGTLLTTTTYTLSTTMNDSVTFPWGWDSVTVGRYLDGRMNRVRVSNVAFHRATSFATTVGVDYPAVVLEWSTFSTEETTPTPTIKMAGRDVDNSPIEITRKNSNKAIVGDFGNVSGSITPDFTSYEELTMATTGAVTDLGNMTGLGVNEAGILTIDNSGGYAVDTNSVSILTATQTGTYNKAFVNRAGTYYYIDAGGEEKEI